MNQETITTEIFHYAVSDCQSEYKLSYLEAFKRVLSQNRHIIDCYNEAGVPTLHHAILSFVPDTVKILLELGANIELKIKANSDFVGYQPYNGLNALECAQLNLKNIHKEMNGSNAFIDYFSTMRKEQTLDIYNLVKLYHEKKQLETILITKPNNNKIKL